MTPEPPTLTSPQRPERRGDRLVNRTRKDRRPDQPARPRAEGDRGVTAVQPGPRGATMIAPFPHPDQPPRSTRTKPQDEAIVQ
jgi:hypothetical protein